MSTAVHLHMNTVYYTNSVGGKHGKNIRPQYYECTKYARYGSGPLVLVFFRFDYLKQIVLKCRHLKNAINYEPMILNLPFSTPHYTQLRLIIC